MPSAAPESPDLTKSLQKWLWAASGISSPMQPPIPWDGHLVWHYGRTLPLGRAMLLRCLAVMSCGLGLGGAGGEALGVPPTSLGVCCPAGVRTEALAHCPDGKTVAEVGVGTAVRVALTSEAQGWGTPPGLYKGWCGCGQLFWEEGHQMCVCAFVCGLCVSV